MWLQLIVVLAAIIIGARLGGIGLGVMGGLGLALLCFVFGLQPTAPPIDVMLMIVAVISAASCMQAAGGLDYMVKLAERMLRKHPSRVTLLSPLVTYLFTFVAGTGHIAYSVLPVIAESRTSAWHCCHRFAAGYYGQSHLGGYGCFAGDAGRLRYLFVRHPEDFRSRYLDRGAGGGFLLDEGGQGTGGRSRIPAPSEGGVIENRLVETASSFDVRKARISVGIFLLATFLIVLFGSVDALRPVFQSDGKNVPLDMPSIIEIVMLSTSALILLVCRIDGIKAVQGSIFSAGMQAVIAIFGIAWMGDTFIAGNLSSLTASIEHVVQSMPWLFGVALFVMSILLYSQAATIRAVVPLGIALSISPWMLIALFPAVNGYFFIPNYPTVVAAINFDRTGTTRIGKYVLNHSFMMPSLMCTIVSIAVGLLLIWL